VIHRDSVAEHSRRDRSAARNTWAVLKIVHAEYPDTSGLVQIVRTNANDNKTSKL
jgi:hypothetical protein